MGEYVLAEGVLCSVLANAPQCTPLYLSRGASTEGV